jgi:hypothetical protein
MIFTSVLIIALGAIVLRVMVRVVTVWSREKALAALANWAQAEALEVISVKSPLFLPISQSGPGCQFFQVVLKDGRGALLRAWIRFPDFGGEGRWNLKVTWDTEPETRLSKQQRIRLAASVATVLVVVCAAILYSTGPYYHGKSFRTWAQMLGRLDVDSTRFECGWGEQDENWNPARQNAEAADAIRHLGSRSFSRLVHAIKAQESPWRSKLAKSLPSWLRGALPATDLTRPREGAVLALAVLGTQAETGQTVDYDSEKTVSCPPPRCNHATLQRCNSIFSPSFAFFVSFCKIPAPGPPLPISAFHHFSVSA